MSKIRINVLTVLFFSSLVFAAWAQKTVIIPADQSAEERARFQKQWRELFENKNEMFNEEVSEIEKSMAPEQETGARRANDQLNAEKIQPYLGNARGLRQERQERYEAIQEKKAQPADAVVTEENSIPSPVRGDNRRRRESRVKNYEIKDELEKQAGEQEEKP